MAIGALWCGGYRQQRVGVMPGAVCSWGQGRGPHVWAAGPPGSWVWSVLPPKMD